MAAPLVEERGAEEPRGFALLPLVRIHYPKGLSAVVGKLSQEHIFGLLGLELLMEVNAVVVVERPSLVETVEKCIFQLRFIEGRLLILNGLELSTAGVQTLFPFLGQHRALDRIHRQLLILWPHDVKNGALEVIGRHGGGLLPVLLALLGLDAVLFRVCVNLDVEVLLGLAFLFVAGALSVLDEEAFGVDVVGLVVGLLYLLLKQQKRTPHAFLLPIIKVLHERGGISHFDRFFL